MYFLAERAVHQHIFRRRGGVSSILIESTEIGSPKSVREIQAMVGTILSKKGGSVIDRVSTGWWK